jgi:starch-binding outer membrane protein, SusD/RagB family
MKKRISKIFYLALMSGVLLLITARCVKLDESPKDFTGPDNFYKSVSQIEAAFASSMNRLWGGWTFYDWMGYPDYPSIDDQKSGGDLNIDDGFANGCWTVHYRAIADVNPAIKALNNDVLGSSATQEVKDQLMAQAKFLRAFNYFNLVRLYGDVPLIIETTNVVTDEITRAPAADVYALIISDLIFATENLPATWPDYPGRPGTDAAKTLLAKVYITMATFPTNDVSYYPKARDLAKEVMDAGTHDLVPEVDKVFAMENGFGPEIMWSYINAADEYVIEPQIWLPGEMADGWGDVVPERAWAEAFPDEPRKNAYLLLEDWNGNSWTTWDQGTPSVKKFLMDSRENLESAVSYQNMSILRFADVLLLFAEAENMVNGGPTQAAVDAVNRIIDRATGGVPNAADPRVTTSMSKEAFDAAVIQQRNLELCFEYDRWFDIVRKRILYEVSLPAYQPNYNIEDYLMPIPQNDLRLNLLITQNPGYTDPTP